jgi:hypothetical protein
MFSLPRLGEIMSVTEQELNMQRMKVQAEINKCKKHSKDTGKYADVKTLGEEQRKLDDMERNFVKPVIVEA